MQQLKNVTATNCDSKYLFFIMISDVFINFTEAVMGVVPLEILDI